METKKIIRYGGSTPIINLYPSDLRDIVKLDADIVITTTWGEDVVGHVIPEYHPETNEIRGFTLKMERGDESATEFLGVLDAITVFAGKAVSMRKMNPPKGLRNKVSFALGMNREKRTKSLDELFNLYKEQIFIHDEAILNNIASTDKAYLPVRFDFGDFHIVALSDGYGQFNISDGYFYMDGFLKPDQALDILENLPPRYVDRRKVDWVKQLIKAFPEDDSIQYMKRKTFHHDNRSSYRSPDSSQDVDEEEDDGSK